MKSRNAVHASLEDAVNRWLPNILYTTHPAAAEATSIFITNQNSEETKAAYFRILRAFLAWAEHGECNTLATLTTQDLKRYEEGLVRIKGSGPAAPRSRAQALSCLRSYFRALVNAGVLASNPAIDVKGAKAKAKLGAYPAIPADDVGRLLDSICGETLQDLQERAVIALMLFGCARVSAVTKLKYSDIREADGRLVVKLDEKGDNIHWVPLAKEADNYLRAFMAVSGDGASGCDPNPDGYVFRCWSKGRKRLASKPLDRRMCYRMVKRRTRAVGLLGVSNHTFRATGITHFINISGSVEKARRLANHASVNTTKLYDHNDQAVQVEDVDQIDYRKPLVK